MICPRCGTEHSDPNHICPRCFYGRPKAKKQMPKWLVWTLTGVAAVAIIAGSIHLYFQKFYNNNWMHGAWEGSDLSLSFNCEDDTFLLINGELVVSGDFTATQDAFTLTAEDGNVYIYRYDKVNRNKMKLTFNQGTEIRKVTLKKQVEDVEEEEPEEETEEEYLD